MDTLKYQNLVYTEYEILRDRYLHVLADFDNRTDLFPHNVRTLNQVLDINPGLKTQDTQINIDNTEVIFAVGNGNHDTSSLNDPIVVDVGSGRPKEVNFEDAIVFGSGRHLENIVPIRTVNLASENYMSLCKDYRIFVPEKRDNAWTRKFYTKACSNINKSRWTDDTYEQPVYVFSITCIMTSDDLKSRYTQQDIDNGAAISEVAIYLGGKYFVPEDVYARSHLDPHYIKYMRQEIDTVQAMVLASGYFKPIPVSEIIDTGISMTFAITTHIPELTGEIDVGDMSRPGGIVPPPPAPQEYIPIHEKIEEIYAMFDEVHELVANSSANPEWTAMVEEGISTAHQYILDLQAAGLLNSQAISALQTALQNAVADYNQKIGDTETTLRGEIEELQELLEGIDDTQNQNIADNAGQIGYIKDREMTTLAGDIDWHLIPFDISGKGRYYSLVDPNGLNMPDCINSVPGNEVRISTFGIANRNYGIMHVWWRAMEITAAYLSPSGTESVLINAGDLVHLTTTVVNGVWTPYTIADINGEYSGAILSNKSVGQVEDTVDAEGKTTLVDVAVKTLKQWFTDIRGNLKNLYYKISNLETTKLSKPAADNKLRIIRGDAVAEIYKPGHDVIVDSSYADQDELGIDIAPYKTIQGASNAKSSSGTTYTFKILGGEYLEDVVINDRSNRSFSGEAIIQQYRTSVNSFRITGSSQRIALKDLLIENDLIIDSTAANHYLHNVGVKGNTSFGATGYIGVKDCDFMGNITIGAGCTVLLDNCANEGKLITINGGTLITKNCTGLTIKGITGSHVELGGSTYSLAAIQNDYVADYDTGFTIVQLCNSQAVSSTLSPLKIRIDNGIPYVISGFIYDYANSVVNETFRVQSGITSLQIYDTFSRAGYTDPTNPYIKDHLDSISTKLSSLESIATNGLKTPLMLNLESQLPLFSSSIKGDYYVIQDMDVTMPGRQGRAWNDGQNSSWQKVYDLIHQYDGLTIVLNASGELEIAFGNLVDGTTVTWNNTTKKLSAPLQNDESKVNVSDIINNLTNTATDKPLSAAMGKQLKDLVDTKQDIVVAIDSNTTAHTVASLVPSANNQMKMYICNNANITELGGTSRFGLLIVARTNEVANFVAFFLGISETNYGEGIKIIHGNSSTTTVRYVPTIA